MASNKPVVGSIAWIDQTSPIADDVRDFYAAVVGWRPAPVSMGDYNDYNMLLPNADQPAAGICHTQGVNIDIPVGWLVYIVVEDLDLSLAACLERGGRVIAGPKTMGQGARYAIIEDPAGAVAALYAPE